MKGIVYIGALSLALTLGAPALAAGTLPASAFPFVAPNTVTVDVEAPVALAPGIHSVDARIHVGKDVVRGRFVESDGGRLHPGVLFVHWLGDPKTTNLTEFLPEALALARDSGVTSLLIDTMWAKPDWFEKGRTTQTDYDDSLRQVAQLRGALDALAERAKVDAMNLAFVGHDFGAMYGAVLAGFDHRPRYFVFIAGVPTFAEWYLLGAKPADEAAYVRQMTPLDPVAYLPESTGSDYLYQFALKDRYVPLPKARAFFDASPGPKTLAFYTDDHGVRSNLAVADRLHWLEERLGRSARIMTQAR
jgi:predicted esterase